jgi:hypothetical protein
MNLAMARIPSREEPLVMRIGGGLWAWSSACGSSVEGGVVEGVKGRRGARRFMTGST